MARIGSEVLIIVLFVFANGVLAMARPLPRLSESTSPLVNGLRALILEPLFVPASSPEPAGSSCWRPMPCT